MNKRTKKARYPSIKPEKWVPQPRVLTPAERKKQLSFEWPCEGLKQTGQGREKG